MSRAFIKEDGAGQDNDSLPDRPVSPGPNYVTPSGKKALEDALRALAEQISAIPILTDNPEAKERRKRFERDFRYYEKRLGSAVVVDNSKNPPGEILFGAVIEADDDRGRNHRFAIVGIDEADAPAGRISWNSPLA
ncbi:MAG: GreA/GreB family elongation factor, partial [Elusimicrobia bacterium]|nr:GreA/GreB family elongation factor [Elusimicrobiota bacterium]